MIVSYGVRPLLAPFKALAPYHGHRVVLLAAGVTSHWVVGDPTPSTCSTRTRPAWRAREIDRDNKSRGYLPEQSLFSLCRGKRARKPGVLELLSVPVTNPSRNGRRILPPYPDS
ncbi:hypothetical protein EVAR_79268_1 [Eumeta japonica]|uniref:Uncharacterized protein n=1 Tax=Eumeta variegata TaxID=151549 RepID=A0A4C1TEN1_EUMVA|nr:hypothetical protein EVAR_79268_1 [Eumeta japonica]